MRFMRNKKAQLAVLLSGIVMIFMFLSGCDNAKSTEAATEPNPSGASAQQPTVTDSNDSTNAENNKSNSAIVINDGVFTTSYEYLEDDLNSDWNERSATIIAFNGSSAQVSGSGASFSSGMLTIKQAGTYVLSGTLTNGQILIDAKNSDIVRLVMNGVSLHNETGPAIYVPQSEKVILILAEGTQNAVSDGAEYTALGNGDEPDAAIFIQDDLSITGSGVLTVTGNHKHGIRTQDILAITDGNINVTTTGDALRGRDGVAIQNGNITLTAGGDGIQSNNANSDDMGFVVINGGTFSIDAKNDGIQAQSSLTIINGTFKITTGGGYENAPAREEDFRGGWGGRQGQTPSIETEENSVSMKALKAGKQIYVMGGDFTINAEDDGIHSNNNIHIAAGRLNIQTGDDGIHADNIAEISGGEIYIPVCYEGIEGLSVTISGGDISIIASDDAINAAGGVDSALRAGGPMGRDQFATNGDIFIRVTGGTLDLFAPRDGMDANGNIFLEGGIVKISGPSQGMEGAIDLDGTMLVTGGELITAGSVLNASSESTQPVILVSYTRQQAEGSVIAVKDVSGNTLLEYTSRIAYTMSGFTSQSFKSGETYSLFIDGEKRVDITLAGNVTSIADDGSVYNGGRGGGRGNWGGGGGMPPGGGMSPSGGNRQGGDMSDMGLMQQAMQIITDAGGELTEEVKNALLELGLTEEQIAMLSDMLTGRPSDDMWRGGFPNSDGQNRTPDNNGIESEQGSNTSL